jgi:hypothetical protein
LSGWNDWHCNTRFDVTSRVTGNGTYPVGGAFEIGVGLAAGDIPAGLDPGEQGGSGQVQKDGKQAARKSRHYGLAD